MLEPAEEVTTGQAGSAVVVVVVVGEIVVVVVGAAVVVVVGAAVVVVVATQAPATQLPVVHEVKVGLWAGLDESNPSSVPGLELIDQ
jgi:hypothetical protein